MSNIKNIVLRIQSSEGTKRIEVAPDDTIQALYEKACDAFSLGSFEFSIYRSRNKKDELASSRSRLVSKYGLRHGDILYLFPLGGANIWPQQEASGASISSTSQSTPSGEPTVDKQEPVNSLPAPSIVEHEVDQILWGMDGNIQRERDSKLCRHGRNARCIHCSPVEPYDSAYLKEQNIKHMSFHSYLRKLQAGIDRGKYIALDNINCKIKSGCKEHRPWPKGICSKCQPTAITLNRQVYRHVDNVMFENPEIVERFLDYWRTSGHQRVGYLYGKYEVHADVPLGIRATVAAIYEPPQESTRDKIKLLPDERDSIVEDIAKQLGLMKVGWIFTDLVAEDVQKGTVKHVRNIETHFLSAQECIMAGHFQNLHPNPCKLSPTGYFGSKFVTVCVTGDSKNQVHMEGYAVTWQCMALVRDQCLIPTRDLPQLGYVKESSDRQFVPDVYYKEKDSYGNEVLKLARPLPVEYLLVDVPASTPLTPLYTFRSEPNIINFPVENRMLDKHIQDFNALASYLRQFTPEQFLSAASDFHFLLYIATMDMLPMKDYMGPLLQAVKERDRTGALEWSSSEHWATVEQVAATAREGGPSVPQPEWTCPHCTFLNLPHLQACDMCSLPR